MDPFQPPLPPPTYPCDDGQGAIVLVGRPADECRAAYPAASPGPLLAITALLLRSRNLASAERSLRALIAQWPWAVALPGAQVEDGPHRWEVTVIVAPH